MNSFVVILLLAAAAFVNQWHSAAAADERTVPVANEISHSSQFPPE